MSYGPPSPDGRHLPPAPRPGASHRSYPPLPPENRTPLIALVCGVIGLFGLPPFSIAAVIAGHVATREVNAARRFDGREMARAGFVLGLVGLALDAIVLAAIVLWLLA